MRKNRTTSIKNAIAVIAVMSLLTPQNLFAQSEGEQSCSEPAINWRNYEWTLITGKGEEACEDMLAYLKSLPEDVPPPVCPEDRLPPTKTWSRPKARFMSEEEKLLLIREMPEEKPWVKKEYEKRFQNSELMQVIEADITRDGVTEMFLGYSTYDYREKCQQSTMCAVINEVFSDAYKYQIRLTSDSFDLLPMNEEGTQVDWYHRTAKPNPMLMKGNLIFFRERPYWMSSVRWGQASHDDFAHSRMRPRSPYSAIFTLAEIGIGTDTHNKNNPSYKDVTVVTIERDPESKNVCRYGYFHRDNLKLNAP